jgi:hypothetical protein
MLGWCRSSQTSSRRYGLLTNPACTSQNHGFISSSISNVPESMKHDLSCSLPGVGNGTIMTRRMGQALGNFLCSESSHPAERHEWHRTDLWCYKPCPNGSRQYFCRRIFPLSGEVGPVGATTLRGKLQLRLGMAEQIPNPTRRQPF